MEAGRRGVYSMRAAAAPWQLINMPQSKSQRLSVAASRDFRMLLISSCSNNNSKNNNVNQWWEEGKGRGGILRGKNCTCFLLYFQLVLLFAININKSLPGPQHLPISTLSLCNNNIDCEKLKATRSEPNRAEVKARLEKCKEKRKSELRETAEWRNCKELGRGVGLEGQRCVCAMPEINDNNNAIVTTTTLNGNCSSQYYVVFDRCCFHFKTTLWALSTESLWTGWAVAIQNWFYNSQLTRKQFTIASHNTLVYADI